MLIEVTRNISEKQNDVQYKKIEPLDFQKQKTLAELLRMCSKVPMTLAQW